MAARIGKAILLQALLVVAVGAATLLSPVVGHCQRRPMRGARTSSLHWDQVPLADGLARVAITFGATIRLDRRIDPTVRISLDTKDANLVETLRQAAAAAGLGTCPIATVHYIGPVATAEQLRTLVAIHDEEVAELPADLRTGLLARRPFVWSRLAEPRALVGEAVSARGWQLSGAERIPHDLWAGGGLPAMTLVEQLSVLLAEFDLTFQLDAARQTIEVVRLAEPWPRLNRRYRVRYGAAVVESLRQQFPAAQMRLDADWLSVDARLEDHERLAASLAGTPSAPAIRPPAAPGKQVYTLRVEEQTVRAVVNTLAQRLNLQLEVDERVLAAAGLSLDRRVTFDVREASEDELLSAVLQPAGLDFRREGARVRIVPRGTQ
jgi:hypothetical protein